VERLSDLPVLVVDCQTTGATPAHGVVLEIGWGIANARESHVSELQAHWLALPPGHFVGRQVRRLTGFDEAAAATRLEPAEAWRRVNFPAAIHFAKFELNFLRDWCARFEPGSGFPFEAVCVHAIACRLYPDLPRRSLRALAGFLGHSVALERRCFGHVQATAFIWRALVAELERRSVGSWSELTAWLEAPAPGRARTSKRRFPLAPAVYRSLPDEPGVYHFVRSNGDVLYVGKAASLRKRVASHFTQRALTERALEMLTQVHSVNAVPVPSALEAALLENDRIKALQPPYNIQLMASDRPAWFVDCAGDSAAAQPDAVHRRGPLPSLHAVRAFGAIQRLAAGEAAALELVARAVGSPQRFAPDALTFSDGFTLFRERHGLAGAPRELERALIDAAKRLLATKTEVADTESEDDDVLRAAGSWDVERVVRHLERGTAQAFRLLQRARWLCLLYDSAVVFQEPPLVAPRAIRVEAGNIGASLEAAGAGALPARFPYRPRLERQRSFDRVRYDALRTLTSELKRILRDGGSVEVCTGRGRWLRRNELEALLRWV
jgi:DNA polymerase-3 subunit epsilon